MTEGKSVMIKGKVFIDDRQEGLTEVKVHRFSREKSTFCLKLKVVETNYKSSKIYLRYWFA